MRSRRSYPRPARLRGWLARLVLALIVLAALGHIAYLAWLRSWVLTWGASAAEACMTLPGDALVPHPMEESTRAVTIHAPRDRVWALLAQMGQAKAGFYSYELLENLAGCRMHNTYRVVPAWQAVRVGDLVKLGKPEGYPAYRVSAANAPKSLVLRAAEPGAHDSWAFVLARMPRGDTRLIVRSRRSWKPTIASNLVWAAAERVQFVMERKMLLTIGHVAASDTSGE